MSDDQMEKLKKHHDSFVELLQKSHVVLSDGALKAHSVNVRNMTIPEYSQYMHMETSALVSYGISRLFLDGVMNGDKEFVHEFLKDLVDVVQTNFENSWDEALKFYTEQLESLTNPPSDA